MRLQKYEKKSTLQAHCHIVMAKKKECPPQAADNHTINNERPEKLSGLDAGKSSVKLPISQDFDVPNLVKRLPIIP
jgi:hypothetical protein